MSHKKHKMVCLSFWCLLCLFVATFAQQPPASRKVLAVYWYDKDYPWNTMFDQRFQIGLKSDPSQKVEYYAEYLETNRFPADKVYSLLHDYLREKYAGQNLDAVVATSDTSLDFLLKYRSDLFPQ